MFGLDTSEILSIAALLAGPFIGIYAQTWVEYYKERRVRQNYTFRILMANRANRLATIYVEALNSIPIDFPEKSKRGESVVKAWKILLDQFCNRIDRKNFQTDAEYNSASRASNQKTMELSDNLLFEMSKYLGYNFNELDIKNGCYFPEGHEIEGNIDRSIRLGLFNLFEGHIPLDINIKKYPEQESNKDGDKHSK